ncbi:hypothetical protein ACFFQW_40565 [Umezawaea endophytica]|uniref:Uncharacterized protein n=1 Tax=Umezawaea endophytica TaxID=1654476 RepID=A0A9X2ZZ77_9PSEU|nr:hypothetical protein [Umezawaea endophytica]MCS7477119.1 hypothetical protein [Umezawaea endophytica]
MAGRLRPEAVAAGAVVERPDHLGEGPNRREVEVAEGLNRREVAGEVEVVAAQRIQRVRAVGAVAVGEAARRHREVVADRLPVPWSPPTERFHPRELACRTTPGRWAHRRRWSADP